MVIIDGHHRLFALRAMGLKKVPVTTLDYLSDEIKTDRDNSVSKKRVIESGLKKNFLEPKSTNHLVFCTKTKIWQPVILLSSLFKLEK